jgi:hypothetical protein
MFDIVMEHGKHTTKKVKDKSDLSHDLQKIQIEVKANKVGSVYRRSKHSMLAGLTY